MVMDNLSVSYKMVVHENQRSFVWSLKSCGIGLFLIVLLQMSGCISKTEEDDKGGEEKMVIYYSDFGAKGDGKTDDIDAIIRAHDDANRKGKKTQF